MPLAGVSGARRALGRGPGGGADRGNGGRAPLPVVLALGRAERAPRCLQPVGDRAGRGDDAGRAAQQVSSPGSRAGVWWQSGRAGGHTSRPSGADPPAVPTRPLPERHGEAPLHAEWARQGFWPGPWWGRLGLHNLGFPLGPRSPEGRGGPRSRPSPRPAGSCPPPEPRQQRDVEGVRRRLVRTLPLSQAPLGLRSSSPVPPSARRKRELF